MDNDVYFVDDSRNAMIPVPPGWGRPLPPRPMMAPMPMTMRPWPGMPQYRRPMFIMQRPPSIFSQINWGDAVERGAAVLAAMQAPPDAPKVCGDPTTDVANMIVYQEGLAKHAKADERVRAFGGVLAEAVKIFIKANHYRAFNGGGSFYGG